MFEGVQQVLRGAIYVQVILVGSNFDIGKVQDCVFFLLLSC